jgi:hypothetical protein
MRPKAFGAEHALHGGAADLNASPREELVREGLLRPYLAKRRCIAFRTAARQSDDLATRLNSDIWWTP